jgi:CspA family cold shock protein
MRFTGRVKWFNEAKGYGFIQQEEGPDVFAHYSSLEGAGFRALQENDEVEFGVTEGPKGLQAVNVEKVYENFSSNRIPSSCEGRPGAPFVSGA